jgi:hypothetical protein
MYDPPLMCPWQCHLIGGPWIAANPSCPFHGSDPVDLEALDPDEGERMCQEETDRREASFAYEGEGEDF